jgi:hypothetical protein
MIAHNVEIKRQAEPAEVKLRREREEHEMANAFARVFLGTPDGKAIFAYLLRKFPIERPAFLRGGPGMAYDPLAAAITDGERRVMLLIQSQIKSGAPT